MLSIIVPAYNEARTLGTVLKRVLGLPVADLQVIVVDDGSSDGTGAIAGGIAATDPRVEVLRHPSNRGKGAAIRTALRSIRGDLVVIQDADLENDPADLLPMLRLFERYEVSIVYGSRWLSCQERGLSASRFAAAVLSRLANGIYGARLTDLPTCYKMFRTDVLRALALDADGFNFCPEVTAKALLAGHAIHEVSISYQPRTRREGKKIRWRDGLGAVWTLARLKYAAVPLAADRGARTASCAMSGLGIRGLSS